MKLDKVAVFDCNPKNAFLPSHRALLQAAASDTEFFYAASGAEMRKLTDDADAVIFGLAEGVKEFCRDAASLKWVQLPVAGFELVVNPNFPKIDELTVTCVKGIHGQPMSDHALAFIYAFLRQFAAIIRNQMKSEWNVGIQAHCEESAGKTVGIVGVGNIGLEIARKCSLLGMRVIGAKRTPIESPWLEHCFSIFDLDEMLSQSDFVILVLPHTKETEKMFGIRQFISMKRSAVMINMARGAIVDTDALIEALRSGEIAGAGLDVTDPEPVAAGFAIVANGKRHH